MKQWRGAKDMPLLRNWQAICNQLLAKKTPIHCPHNQITNTADRSSTSHSPGRISGWIANISYPATAVGYSSTAYCASLSGSYYGIALLCNYIMEFNWEEDRKEGGVEI